ncbi:hypothetical protein [Tsuneonella amylolytica]|uniref:hypothetical protein n=1 Tax=Tsuneonella amylolytica TaxID=2338327 RepID=UPI000EA981F0|nr:hypothetical protein [Tsuneonella amylolytica]
MSDAMRRTIPVAVLAAAIAILGGLYLSGQHGAFAWIMRHWLVMFDMPPFADAEGMLGAIECERAGIETYLGNPCDPKARPFVYTPTWKLLTALPVTRAWTLPVVAVSILAFLAALWALPPAKDRRGLAFRIAAVLSPSTLMAIEYGNNEMLIFALAVAGAILVARSWTARVAAYAVFFLLGLLKYFPFTALALALRERPARLFAVSAATALGLALFAALAGEQLRLSLANIPSMSAMSYVFGVKNFSDLMTASGVTGPVPVFVRGILTAIVVGGAVVLALKAEVRSAAGSLDEGTRIFLLVGGILTVSAYLLAQNVAYRQVHMLMVLPALLAIAAREGSDRRWRALPWIAVGLMYAFTIRMGIRAPFGEDTPAFAILTLAGFFARELAWLVQATVVLALVIAAFPPVPLLERLRTLRPVR